MRRFRSMERIPLHWGMFRACSIRDRTFISHVNHGSLTWCIPCVSLFDPVAKCNSVCARAVYMCISVLDQPHLYLTLGGKGGPVSTINHNSVAFSFLKTKGRRENRFAKITGSFWNDVSCTKRIHISQGKEVQNHPPSHLRDSHRRGSRFVPSMNS